MATHGYVTDTSYTDQFFRELSPAWLNYVAALNGSVPRPIAGAFVYLELGCGFGTSTVVNAGAYPNGEFHACDIIPAHVDGGRRHAAALGVTNATFHEADFDELLARDLPAADFIVLHGVYSWVDGSAREAVRRVIRALLKPGGLAYVSYNCLPGWASEAPLRKLLVELAPSSAGNTAQRTAAAVASLTAFSRARPRYFKANPSALTAIEAYNKRDTEYLVHEFMNEAWQPFYSVDVADELEGIGLRYAGSATLAENHPALLLDAESAKAVAALPTERQQQLATDFAVNQRFRRDVFVRDDVRRDPGSATARSASRTAAERLRATAIGSARPPSAIGVRAAVPRGEVAFHEDFIRDVRALMARGSMTIADTVASLAARGGNADEIARNVIFLVSAGVLIPFAKARLVSDSRPRTYRATPMLERATAYAIEHDKGCSVPSEIMGNGFPLEPAEARALRGVLTGVARPDDNMRELMATLERLGLTLLV
jgi:SAM-dependent methyltransferase